MSWFECIERLMSMRAATKPLHYGFSKEKTERRNSLVIKLRGVLILNSCRFKILAAFRFIFFCYVLFWRLIKLGFSKAKSKLVIGVLILKCWMRSFDLSFAIDFQNWNIMIVTKGLLCYRHNVHIGSFAFVHQPYLLSLAWSVWNLLYLY